MPWRSAGRIGWCAAILIGTASIAFAAAESLRLSSPDFVPGQTLPARCARAHGNTPPELHIAGAPAGARSLVLLVDDPDAPAGVFTHWLVWNIPPSASLISADSLPPGVQQGRNSFGDTAYDGPAPPHGRHHYRFYLYALNTVLTLPDAADRAQLEASLQGHVLAKTVLIGTYAAGD